jgi:hypothetical protein
MVEESEPPGQGSRMGESDFLAERRARRATETGEAALLRRAEAAEATVKTLESHVASLQSRLQEVEEERRRAAALLEAERTHGAERESELRRVKQREYAEQQLRVEAEDRLSGLERTQRAARAPGASVDTGELSRRIEALQRQLSEAEQAAGAERASLRRAEDELQARVAELERRAAEIQRGLVAERSARERSERELAAIREGHRRMEGLLGEIRALISRLGAMLSSVRARPEPPPQQPMPSQQAQPPQPLRSSETSQAAASAAGQRGLEMADALAAAVERLRARAQTAPPLPEDPGELEALRPATPAPVPDPVAPIPPPAQSEAPIQPPAQSQAPIPPPAQPPVAPLTPAGWQVEPQARPVPDTGVGRAPQPPATPAGPATDTPAPAADTAAQAPVEAQIAPAPSVPAKPANKHSQSLIGRIRNRRKQRRAR